MPYNLINRIKIFFRIWIQKHATQQTRKEEEEQEENLKINGNLKELRIDNQRKEKKRIK